MMQCARYIGCPKEMLFSGKNQITLYLLGIYYLLPYASIFVAAAIALIVPRQRVAAD